MKTLREYIDQLDEISRRDFLKGAGAATVAGTAGLVGLDQYSSRGFWARDLDEEDLIQLDFLIDVYHATKKVAEDDPTKKVAFDEVSKVVNQFRSENPGLDQVIERYYKEKEKYWNMKNPESALSFNHYPIYHDYKKYLNRFSNWYKSKKANPEKKEFREESVDEAASPDAVARIEELIKYK
jgi:hypothetical protein